MKEYMFYKNKIPAIINKQDYKFEEIFERNPANILQQVFFEINKNRLSDILEFLKSDTKFLSITGFRGTGKTALLDLSKSLFDPNALILEMNLPVSIVLDDIVLNFYRNIEAFCVKHQIDTLNFKHKKTYSEKVITFLKHLKRPCIIVLDSVNDIFLNDQLASKNKIFDFINFLSEFENIKIILISRNSDHTSYLRYKTEKIKLGPLDIDVFQEIFSTVEISKSIIEDFYEKTRGYFLNAVLAYDLIKDQGTSLSQLINESERKDVPFDEFLFKKLLNSVSEECLRTLKMLSVTRVGFAPAMLRNLDFSENEGLKKKILFKKNESIFIHDYFSRIVFNELARGERNDIHAFLKDIFEKQIELNLNERKLNLSRTTLHNEFDYHKTFYSTEFGGEVAKKQSAHGKFAYISSAAKSSFDWDLKDINKRKAIYSTNSKDSKINISLNAKDIEDIEKALSEEELKLLESSDENHNEGTEIEDITETSPSQVQEDISIPNVPTIKTYQDFLNDAQKAETNFDFNRAIYCYNKAVEELPEDKEDKKPFILGKLAFNNEKLHNYDQAIELYKEVLEIYNAKSQTTKANYILLNIANAYKATFEYEEAFDIYENILSSNFSDIPKPQILQAYVGIADYYDYKQNAKQTLTFLIKALNLSQELNDNVVLSEVNFKLALFLDENGNSDNALVYYKKSIDSSNGSRKNDFLSSAYSNVATIYKEKGDYKKSIDNYKLALKIDLAANNFDGIIFIYQKLADVYARRDANLAVEYLHNALKYAKRTNDGYYLASSYLALGDFYFNAKMYDKAVKSYVFAERSYGQNISSENKAKIEMRFNDVKAIIGDNNYKHLISGLNK